MFLSLNIFFLIYFPYLVKFFYFFHILFIEVIDLNNMNFDENTINKLKDMMNKGDLNDVMSKISPEMIQNFSSIMSQNNENSSNSDSNTNNTNQNGFDFSQIDMNTILKMKSVMDKLNTSNDPRSNLLYSLKPYLREEKKGKVDQYANLLNVAKIADLLKDNNKESPHNG